MSSVMFIGGIWDDGIIIDDYTKESKYLGEDAFGNPIFDTTYTEIGKLLHDMKYNGHYNTSEKNCRYMCAIIGNMVFKQTN